ncbi:MAG TPA: amidophosphoribosyltransferase, partial [Propionicimonas sp.]
MQSPDELFDDPGPRDACGVFGVWAPGEEVAKLTYFGLYALQHRGQESAGMAVSNGERIMVFKDMGLVSQVFDEPTLNSLNGYMAVGHCRYSTTGSSTWSNAQPTFRGTAAGGLALAHNGNLTNTDELEAWLATSIEASEVPHKDGMDSTSDTALVTALMAVYADDGLKAAA